MWLQRLYVVTYVLVCIWAGLLLIALPWLPIWSNNELILRFPALYHFLQFGFVRGAVSGLGLVDIFMGLWEAFHYHDRT